MVGGAIYRNLKLNGYGNPKNGGSILIPKRSELDLLNINEVEEWFKFNNPSVVIIAAARVGGIHANNNYPYDFLMQNMQIQNINDMSEQAIWEYNKGSKINDDDIKIAFDKKNNSLIQIDEIFKKFDFIILPSSQVFPFNKNIQYPKKINEQELDTYHRWLEVFIISSLFDLPTLTVPIGFNETGSPMVLQIIAKKGDDIKLLSFAKTYEKIYKYSNIKTIFK